MTEPEIRVVGRRVIVAQGSETLVTAPLADVLAQIARTLEQPPACGMFPAGVRAWRQRDDAVGVAVEVPPHARTVRWLTDDSKADFGRRARYGRYFLAFPYVVLLLVFRRGSLTGSQQLYYRRSPLEDGDDGLFLPNLYNVAHGYGQQCWVCLANLDDVGHLPWPAKLRAIVDHVFTSAWNRSSEVNEGNSYFGAMRDLDPRISSPEAWEAATRQNPRFPTEVEWRSAKTTASRELATMLDSVIAPPSLSSAGELVALLARGGRRGHV